MCKRNYYYCLVDRYLCEIVIMSSIAIILILSPKRDDAIALVHIFELFIYYLCLESLSFWTVCLKDLAIHIL